jgi:hypothetical protein
VSFAWKFGVVMLVALALTVLPGGGDAVFVMLRLLLIAFFVAIALLGARMYREHRFRIDSLDPRLRLVLFGSIGLAFLTFTANELMFSVGAAGIVGWFALLALCSYGIFSVYSRARAYE